MFICIQIWQDFGHCTPEKIAPYGFKHLDLVVLTGILFCTSYVFNIGPNFKIVGQILKGKIRIYMNMSKILFLFNNEYLWN